MSRRFEEPRIYYGERMARFSLLDVNNYFKKYNGAPQLNKFSGRPDFFKKEELEDVEEQRRLRFQMIMQQAKDQKDKADGDEQAKKDNVIEQKPNFSPTEHDKVVRMKPYIKQIVADMKKHTREFNSVGFNNSSNSKKNPLAPQGSLPD